MTIETIGQDELKEITQCWSAKAKIDWLETNGIPFTLNNDGTPRVLRFIYDKHKDSVIAAPDKFNQCLKNQFPFYRRCSGIYFLYYQDDLVYIGQTTTFFVRMAAHDKSGLDWDEVIFVPLHKHEIALYEEELIARHNPSKNRNLNKSYFRSRVAGN